MSVGKLVTVGGEGPFAVTGMFDDDDDGSFERLVLDGAPSLQGAGASAAVEVVVRVITAGDVPVVVDSLVTVVGGAYGGRVTRHDGGNWADDGFMEGQLVMIQGLTGSWRLQRIENVDDQAADGSVLWLTRGVELLTIDMADAIERQVFWPGPHGGLTVVHGGGNSELEINFEIQTQMTGTDTSSVTRLDGRSWTDTGFSMGDRIRVDAAGNTTWRIDGFADDACPFTGDPYPGCGDDSVMLLVQDLDGSTVGVPMPTLTEADGKHSVYVADAGIVTTTDMMNITVQEAGPLGLPTTTLTCETPGCFGSGATSASGTVFEPGMVVHLSGVAGGFTVVSVTGNELVLQGASLETTYSHLDANDPTADANSRVFEPIELTVSGRDADIDGGIRMGGDHIVVCNLANTDDPCGGPEGTNKIAGPDSPLVVYGDTSQDAVWYSGERFSVKGHEFGPKPFDPFWKLPEQENEDDEWLFPLASPYPFAGNDVIDGSGLFAGVTCVEGDCDLPTVGFTAYGGEGDDLIIGSQTGDHLAGGSGNDTILGLRGTDHIYGDGGVNVNILTRALSMEFVDRSPAPTLDPRPIPEDPADEDPPIKPGDFTLAPNPALNRDFMAAGDDEIHGEGAHTYTVGSVVVSVSSVPGGPQFAYDDVIFGDHGEIIQQVADPNQPDERLQKIQTTTLASIRSIVSRAFQNAGDDQINGMLGRDVIVGGAGNDMADGDEQDDLVFGDNIFLTRRIIEELFPTATDWVGDADVTSGRFQTLCGDSLYSRTDRADANGNDACGNTVHGDNSGKLLVDGVWRDFRDPDGPDLDTYPWWAEYRVDFDDDTTDLDEFHSFDVQLSVSDPGHEDAKGLGSFGNDYLAGGADNDLVFGQMGDDIVQGDGGIESASAAEFHVGASRSPDGCRLTTDGNDDDPTAAGACDLVGDLDLIASDDAVTDGEDYIEGNGGNDIVFGGLGQDDIIGGSSDFFSLDVDASGVDSPDLRPDGADLLFGGSGIHTARSDNGGLDAGGAIPGVRHVRDADTIVGDNGRIIRIVGTNGCDELTGEHSGTGSCQADPAGRKYVSYVYDDTYGAEIVVRGVDLLDYTPGGPDFRPDRFDLGADGPCSTSAPATQDGCGEVFEIPNPNGTNRITSAEWDEIFGNDEVHGGLGDDFIYLGAGHDVAYGDADDDDIIGGWGNDWLSGGVGSDGILGDDGRIFTSRNSDAGWTAGSDTDLPPNCGGSGDGACFSEPLHGITAFQPQGTCTENKSVLCGDFLDQYISSPGEVQTAVINIGGDLRKTVDLTPYNLTPGELGLGDRPMFDANNSDDVIFGGLGGEILPNYPTEIGHRNNEDPPFGLMRGVQGDFLHGGSGDDAIAGGESIWNAYTQIWFEGSLWDADDDGTSDAVRTDWTRPFNPGDLLHFGEDDDAWHNNGPIVNRLGEFALYDEYDPRRTILLNGDATVDKAGDGLMWFLNLYSDEGPTLDGCVEYLPNGTCVATAHRHSDGGDAMFGDLGNDWMAGGTGIDTLWGGWGNDLLNADDVMTIDGDGAFGDQKGRKIQPSPNDIPDTHPLYADRAYGGAGLDILIGNTGADRLIDWVGEFNSYIVPFAPFGIATVSRQRAPQLDQFLYELSESQGADPTRDTDTGNSPERNGEPDGEIGLVMQKAKGLWQDQTGGPSDPQPGNIPGGRRDVLRSADFNDGQMNSFAPDSGAWAVAGGELTVAAESLGGDAVAVFYVDGYLPIYYEIEATINVIKPTAGWKANSYVIFDYFGQDDFKFAGVDDSRNKIQMGYRDANGWHVVAETPHQVKSGTDYDILVAVNGTYVTVVLGNKSFSHTFDPRMILGDAYGLNQGLIGFGSDNSRGSLDNIAAQILPPEWTLEDSEDFDDGQANLFTGDQSGTWTTAGGSHSGMPSVGEDTALDLVDLGIGRGLVASSFLELEVTVSTSATGGVVFDHYGPNDYKFVALDVAGDQVLVGHESPNGGWTIDTAVARNLDAGTDYTIRLHFKGASVSIFLNGQMITSWGYNSAIVDGSFGTLSRSGTASFDSFILRTDDPAFTAIPLALRVAPPGTPPPERPQGPPPDKLDESDLASLVDAAKAYWIETLGDGLTAGQLATLDTIRFSVANLAEGLVGLSTDDTIYLDLDADGYGYSHGGGEIDALFVVIHEMGHLLGFTHDDVDERPEMYPTAYPIDGQPATPAWSPPGDTMETDPGPEPEPEPEPDPEPEPEPEPEPDPGPENGKGRGKTT